MINSVTLVGNLGNDPGLKKLENGTLCSEFRIACNEIRNDNGEKVERTHWFSCDVYGKTAELCHKYLKKGSRVGIRGPLQYHAWKDEKGNQRSLVRINVRDIEFLDSKPANEKPGARVPVNMRDF
ncbi:MAG: hypothetical protein A2161_03220 [Candidatus Schekmanbacteria bacterium RBG_13_48_7]|uniref:Single-stranded DNA-binding protein n=1 Tax=Candidatus Schekmanbacteria bacterium RBG_13_48_7 TaxID=1817878 RepID=A0A1F7RRQ4_9BACT|nr:MAG: hypothetical protein A2161_03220 [Candidatus Schekmanbacteria bacterium RBG_13_48_7]